MWEYYKNYRIVVLSVHEILIVDILLSNKIYKINFANIIKVLLELRIKIF